MNDTVYEETITLPASTLPSDSDLLSFDKGCSLTKVVVGRREGNAVKFYCRTYKNSDADAALEWLSANSELRADSTVKVTGVGGDILCKEIADQLKCRTCFVDEFQAQQKGAELLLRHGKEEEVFHPDPKLIFKDRLDAEAWKEIRKTEPEATMDQQLYPTVFAYIGSGLGISLINEDEEVTSTVVGGTCLAGKAFLGFAKLILDTTNFNEIDELAMKGNREKVDLLGSEVVGECQSALYAAFPKDVTFFHFGKLAENSSLKENLTKADKAASLLGLFAQFLHDTINQTTRSRKGNRIVIGGNFVRSQYFREYCFSLFNIDPIKSCGKKLKFLKTGHTAAIGMLLLKNEEMN